MQSGASKSSVDTLAYKITTSSAIGHVVCRLEQTSTNKPSKTHDGSEKSKSISDQRRRVGRCLSLTNNLQIKICPGRRSCGGLLWSLESILNTTAYLSAFGERRGTKNLKSTRVVC